MHKKLYVHVRCCREDYREIKSTPVDMYQTRLGPLPDPLGCDIFAETAPCKECRKYLIEYLMYHKHEEDTVLDPREPIPPKPDA